MKLSVNQFNAESLRLFAAAAFPLAISFASAPSLVFDLGADQDPTELRIKGSYHRLVRAEEEAAEAE